MKSQDVLVALSLIGPQSVSTYASLAAALGMSSSEAHAAVGRLERAQLVNPERKVIRRNLLEFILHGLRYVFPAAPGGPTVGVPTGTSAPAIGGLLTEPDEGPWVWPWPDGQTRGLSIEPLHPASPGAALRSPQLYELLALVDLLRAGRARERGYAERRFKELLR